MVLFNADGSRAEMSGNGIRCFAQALATRRGDLAELTIRTDAGPRRVELQPTEDPQTVLASVDLGEVDRTPRTGRLGRPRGPPGPPGGPPRTRQPALRRGRRRRDRGRRGELGRRVPQINLEIIEPGPEPHAITMRVHERGAGVTEACGTGAAAAGWAAARWGLVDCEELVVHMDGGSARVSLHRPEPGCVTLTGPATYVATIEIPSP